MSFKLEYVFRLIWSNGEKKHHVAKTNTVDVSKQQFLKAGQW